MDLPTQNKPNVLSQCTPVHGPTHKHSARSWLSSSASTWHVPLLWHPPQVSFCDMIAAVENIEKQLHYRWIDTGLLL